MCQIYSRLTIKTPEQRLAPLLLTLNIFLTLFYCYYCWIRTKKNVSWAREIIVPDNKFAFSNCEKYIVLWAGENCLVTSFHSYLSNIRLREKCPNTELFLIRIFLYSDWIRRDLPYLSVFSPNTGKYGQEITPYLDTFHAVKVAKVYKFWRRISKRWVEPCCFVDGIPP